MTAPRQVLVTGAGGFLGRGLVRRLAARGDAVCAVVRPGAAPPAVGLPAGVRVCAADVRDAAALRRAVEASRPDGVFHLAAQSFPTASWQDPAGTYAVNVLGTLNLFEALRQVAPAARVLVAGSSAEYAPEEGAAPIPEEAPLRPNTPYGISKFAAEQVAAQYARHYGMPVVRVRPFFLIGPGKAGDVCSDFARGVVAVERGRAPDVAVGNLDVVRDFLDARDGLAALELALERGAPGAVYNVCSGQGCRLGAVLDRLVALACRPIPVRPDPARIRPMDNLRRIGCPDRLRALGWAPATPLERTLAEILDYWREQPGA